MWSGPEGDSARDSVLDACPGAVRVHRAADGGLARVRVPGGILSAKQLAVLGRASVELGDGSLELTSRGNVQVRALAEGAEVELGRRLQPVGLLPSTSHERVRNIIASPLSGRDGRGFLDVRPIASDLDRRLISTPVLADLSGRFLFTVDDGRNDLADLTADVGTIATGPATMALLLAGTDTGIRTAPDRAARLMIEAAVAFLAERAAQDSPAWRISELPNAIHLLTTRITEAHRPDTDRSDVLPASSRVGTGRLGSVAQVDGRVAVTFVVPLGRLRHPAVEALTAAAGEIIVTPWRTVVVPDLSPEDAEHLAPPGLVREAGSPWAGVTSCAGRPHCAKALADVQGIATDTINEAVQDPRGDRLPVHWAGCGRRCGQPSRQHVEVLAVGDNRFTVTLEERTTTVRRDDLATTIADWRSG